MKTSTEIASIAKIVGEERAIEMVAKAGFDYWDFSMFEMARKDRVTGGVLPSTHPLAGSDRLSFARKLKQVGLDCGITCNQSHAPFPVVVKGIRDSLKYAIECTAEAGGKICIVHPDNNKSPEENAEMYFELLPFAKECGVKIATENMWNWNAGDEYSCFASCATYESFCRHLEVVNDEFFVACLDIGHAEMQGSGSGAVNMIHALGSKLQALHIHDNDRRHDSHQIPFSMNINFEAIVRALKEINYSGWFTLESCDYLGSFHKDTVFTGVQDMANVARKIARMFESLA